MKLICYPWAAGGGLLCDTLNNTRSLTQGCFFQNEPSIYFKNPTPDFDLRFWDVRILRLMRFNSWMGMHGHNNWYGTHTHPSKISESMLKQFSDILVVSVETYLSKFYRYLRISAINGPEVKNVKNAFEASVPFPKDMRFDNVEFEDLVDGKFMEERKLDTRQYEIWKNLNPFLYVHPDTAMLQCFNKCVNLYPTGYGYNQWWI